MASNLNSTAINSTNSVPYLTSDRTELAPLCNNTQDTKGLKIIISCMAVVTILISIALATQLHRGHYQVDPHGTVVSDNQQCSEAGVSVMEQGGNAVDGVIATLFCLSVVLPHLVGIGGGGFLLMYDQRQQKTVGCLDFQAATGASHSSVGVPGFVAGLHQAHESFGHLPWADLLTPAINILQSGFAPGHSLLSSLPLAAGRKDLLDLVTSGRNPALLSTLESIAVNGSHELYNGSLAAQMEGLVSNQELSDYRVVSDTCLTGTVGGYSFTVAGPYSGGPLLLQLLHKMNQSLAAAEPVVSVAVNLKDTKIVSRPYSSGVNVVAVDHNDIYVSVVSGLGSVLGSLDLTPGGYVMNNLKVFSSGGSEEERLATLASPIVVTQPSFACANRIITGASDVRDAAELLAELLPSLGTTGLNSSLQSIVDTPRARILASQVQVEANHEPQLDAEQLTLLREWNYTVTNALEPYASLNLIHKIGDTVTAVADSRSGGGLPASF